MSYFSGSLSISSLLLLLEDMTLSFACNSPNENIIKFVVLDIRAPSALIFTSIGVSCSSGLLLRSC